MKVDQINVKCGGWKGRVHSTLAKDPVISNDDITVSSPGVFSDVSVGDMLQARIIKIHERKGFRYVCVSP